MTCVTARAACRAGAAAAAGDLRLSRSCGTPLVVESGRDAAARAALGRIGDASRWEGDDGAKSLRTGSVACGNRHGADERAPGSAARWRSRSSRRAARPPPSRARAATDSSATARPCRRRCRPTSRRPGSRGPARARARRRGRCGCRTRRPGGCRSTRSIPCARAAACSRRAAPPWRAGSRACRSG